MVIGKFLISSPTFPPPHTVRDTFASYGVPSYSSDFYKLIYIILYYIKTCSLVLFVPILVINTLFTDCGLYL